MFQWCAAHATRGGVAPSSRFVFQGRAAALRFPPPSLKAWLTKYKSTPTPTSCPPRTPASDSYAVLAFAPPAPPQPAHAVALLFCRATSRCRPLRARRRSSKNSTGVSTLRTRLNIGSSAAELCGLVYTRKPIHHLKNITPSHRPRPFSSRRAAVEDSPAEPNAASKASESALKPESKLINSGNPVSSSPQVVQTKAVVATRAAKPATSKLLGASAKEKCAAGT